MTRNEALVEWDKLLAVRPAPKDAVTPKAKEKASALFAALYPDFEETDEVRANMLLEHNEVVLEAMSRAYQTVMNEEKEDD